MDETEIKFTEFKVAEFPFKESFASTLAKACPPIAPFIGVAMSLLVCITALATLNVIVAVLQLVGFAISQI